MRLALTGPGGRLGRAVVSSVVGDSSIVLLPWGRQDYDLDDADGGARLVERDHPDVVVHTAAWTDVDGCARDPEAAHRRNGRAVEVLATACAEAGARFVLVSTNEVFDGEPRDGKGHSTDDDPCPVSVYGASKLGGEIAARRAFSARPRDLAVVRTSWLFGPPGNDFPTKILTAAERARRSREPLRLVTDEFGVPTSTRDAAESVVALARSAESGIYHAVSTGRASRAEWARMILQCAGVVVDTILISSSEWSRPSRPPAWGVLEQALPAGVRARSWQEATAEYVRDLIAVGAGAR